MELEREMDYGAQTYPDPVSNPDYLTEKYYKMKIENNLVKRSQIIGSVQNAYTEFDDYFEKHVEKFFTPEVDEIFVCHHQGYIFGTRFIFRDSWGKTNKETYKGDLHMASKCF